MTLANLQEAFAQCIHARKRALICCGANGEVQQRALEGMQPRRSREAPDVRRQRSAELFGQSIQLLRRALARFLRFTCVATQPRGGRQLQRALHGAARRLVRRRNLPAGGGCGSDGPAHK